MASADITERLRQRFAAEGVEATPAAVVAAVRQEPENAVLGDTTVLRLADQVRDELIGAGPLAPLLADPAVTDVLVNGVEVWVDRGSGLQRADVGIGSVDDVGRLARRLAASCGRRLDDGRPYADARLPDGSRLHAVLPPVATTGPYLSLRTFRQRPFTLDDLVGHGTVAPVVAPLLTAVVAARLAYLVTGGTGSGKTTLLGTLLGLVPPTERIVLVEDAAELRPMHPHVVALQARTSNVEGAGAVNLTDLVRQALRMRPDRLVVGECRGPEVVDLLGALNTGHDGGAGTLHANAPADVPARLEALGMLGGLPRAALHAQVLAALQVVLQVRRVAEGRVLESVSVLLPAGHERLATVVPAWVRGKGAGPAAEALARMIAARGVPVPAVLADPVTPPRPVGERFGRVVGADGRGYAWSDLVEPPPASVPASHPPSVPAPVPASRPASPSAVAPAAPPVSRRALVSVSRPVSPSALAPASPPASRPASAPASVLGTPTAAAVRSSRLAAVWSDRPTTAAGVHSAFGSHSTMDSSSSNRSRS